MRGWFEGRIPYDEEGEGKDDEEGKEDKMRRRRRSSGEEGSKVRGERRSSIPR